jgi:hypothetical protein
MSSNPSNGQLPSPVASAPVPTTVPLGAASTFDLSFLSEPERKQLLTEYSRGILDVSRKAQELHVEVAVLKATLGTLSGTVKEVAEAGNSATITHTHTGIGGRTEVIMGNTAQAQSGKLTKSQTGERDWTPWYVIGGLIAVVIIAAVAFGH